jgi:hypothetical protein
MNRVLRALRDDLEVTLGDITGNSDREKAVQEALQAAFHLGESSERKFVIAELQHLALDEESGALPLMDAGLELLSFKYAWTANNLMLNGMKTVRAVVEYHHSCPGGLRVLDGIGPKTLLDIRDTLAKIGVDLDAEPAAA